MAMVRRVQILRHFRMSPACRFSHQSSDQEESDGKQKIDPTPFFLESNVFYRRQRDLDHLIHNYTAPALAAALKDRESTLELCAELFRQGLYTPFLNKKTDFPRGTFHKHFQIIFILWLQGKLNELQATLRPFETRDKDIPDENKVVETNLPQKFDEQLLQALRKKLNRIPRSISKNASKRASVIVPLCHMNGIPSVLFTRRSEKVGRYKGQVCFPGGMVDSSDVSIVQTALRELEEEVGLHEENVDVLGILRCDWSVVESITGVAVTPVIGYIGEVNECSVTPNPGEFSFSLF